MTMKQFYLKLILLICFFTFQFVSYGAHIIGGEVTYNCKGFNADSSKVRFEVIFTLFRDSRGTGAQFEPRFSFGIYSFDGTSYTYIRTITNVALTNVTNIDIQNESPCIAVPVNVGVQRGTYKFEVLLDIINDSYYIAYQRCCRNNTILNILNPADTGAAIATEISPESQRSCNNSPTFEEFPPALLCVNRPINYDHSAQDVDGDSLVYEFFAPLSSGGPGSGQDCYAVIPNPAVCLPPFPNVIFDSPKFTFDKPMAGNPVVSIDKFTGIISGVPNILGQFVVGVIVKEYRNGVLIGSLRRDFQFNVTVCETTVAADIKASAKTTTEYIVNSCGDFTINFINESTDARYINDYYWEFNVNGKKEIFTTRDVSYTFPGLGTYTATMIINNGENINAECSDTANISVFLYPSIDADFSFEFDTCKAGPILFTDKSKSGAGPIQKWDWQFGEGSSTFQNPAFEYEFAGIKKVTLVAEDNNKCRDTSIQEIKYLPLPTIIIIDPNTFIGCQPASISFENLSSPVDSTFRYEWDFGDGKTSTDIDPINVYEEIGSYHVNLQLTSPTGCKIAKNWNNLIKIVESPTAGFTYTPEEPNLYINKVQFTDESENAFAYRWTFGESGSSLQQNPSFEFQDTGTFTITQVVLKTNGCTDTATADIKVLPFINFYMPNAFTPNNDGLNDELMPVGIFEGVSSYHFSVYNRWGDLIFETDDYLVGWNGQRNNSGEYAPPGMYSFIVKFTNNFGKPEVSKGHITVLR
jgi:gliding motility-associated-like protein